MKTSVKQGSARPRWVCRAVQVWASVVGDGAAPKGGAWGANHVAGCACCREFFRHGEAWDSALRREAATDSAGAVRASAGLDERIIAAVHRSARAAAEPKQSAGAKWFLLAAGAVAGVAGVIFVVTQATREEPRAGSAQLATIAKNADATDVWKRLQPEAIDLLGATPLQREAEAFYSDARSALGFLALNFLPASALEPAGGADQTEGSRRPASG